MATIPEDKHYPNDIMLDSCAGMTVCPVGHFPECGIQPAGASSCRQLMDLPVEHCGSKDEFHMVGEAMKKRFEVTATGTPE